MKTLRARLACALFPALFAAASAAPLPAGSRITAVTVYTDRAVVTRSAALDFGAAGAVEAMFENLPANLLDQSLQVSGLEP